MARRRQRGHPAPARSGSGSPAVGQVGEHAVLAVDARARRAAPRRPAGCRGPCLPVDSATSCSSHSPRPGSDGEITNVSLSRPPRASALRAAPEPQAASTPAASACAQSCVSSAVSQAAGAPCSRAATSIPTAPRARSRTATARCSARRCRGRPAKTPRKPWRSASSCRPVPGSVIATKLAPSPREREEVREQRQRLDRAARLRGDDEQRAPRVDRVLRRRRSRRRRWSRARAGGAVRPRREGAAQHLRRQRGAAHAEQDDVLDPVGRPPPRRTARAASRSASMRSAIVSQPSRLATSGVPAGPHRVASPLRRRAGISCSTSCATRSCDGGAQRTRDARSHGLRRLAHGTIVVARATGRRLRPRGASGAADAPREGVLQAVARDARADRPAPLAGR